MTASLRTRVKFCGCVDADDAVAAVGAGADAVGAIFAASPRRIDLDAALAIRSALPPMVQFFAVFADQPIEEVRALRSRIPDAVVQLHGGESPAYADAVGGAVVKTIGVPPGADAQQLARDAARYRCAVLFDTSVAHGSGGTGERFDWEAVAAIARARPIIVAGGLTETNVGACVQRLHPYAVDARSGVERGGRKDPEKMRAFVRAVRDADQTG